MDAIELLKKDHQEVTKLFQRFSGGKGDRNGRSVVEKICDELDVHSRIEEEIFYPAVREADTELAREVDEALQEHARVKEQVRMLREHLRDGGDGLAGQVTALQQDVEHHVTEEEGEMFPKVAEVVDGRERTRLGERMQARKSELSGGGRARRARRGGRRAATGRTGTARRRRAKSTQTRSKTKTRRARRSTRRTAVRGAKRATGRARGRTRQRKRARARRR